TWGYNHQLSSRLDGSDLSEVYYSEDDAAFDYFPFGIQAYTSGNLWDMKANLSYTTHYVNKFTFNAGTNAFDKETTTLSLSWYAIQPKYQVVFDESGTTGYVVILGALTDDAAFSMTPRVLKTTDGGATWNVFPYFNFSSLAAMDVLLAADDLVTKRPYFSDMDCTVDADGRLHIFADVESSYYADPLTSIFTIYGAYSALMHVSSSDGTDWTAEVIESNTKSDALFGAVSIDRSPQISRLADGSKIFFTWTQSPDLNTFHDSPNLYAKGYDVATGNYTASVNFSVGTDFENSTYFPTMAPVSRDLGGTYELPVVFADPGVSDLVAAQFYYAMGITFSDADFNFCNPVAPAGLYVDAITATSGVVNWTGVDNADGYTGAIWNLTTGAVRKFHTSGESTSYALPATLTPSTTYGVRLKSICLDAGVISDYSAWYYFTTSPLRQGEFDPNGNIAPNPSNGNFILSFNTLENNNYQLMIFNTVGQVVYSEMQISSEALRHKEIALNVSAGTYYVKLYGSEGVSLQTIIIE
ncbi:MAG: T9SS type A sorting domain-containing protein, partial [Chitinophagales bacterium]